MSEVESLTSEIARCRSMVRAWERLRLLYNGVLLIPGGLALWRTMSLQAELLEEGNASLLSHPLELVAWSVAFGVMANVCYCLGPYLELVIWACGFPITGQRLRYFVFGIGMMVSLAVVGVAWLVVELYAGFSLIPAP